MSAPTRGRTERQRLIPLGPVALPRTREDAVTGSIFSVEALTASTTPWRISSGA
jgi:hypothetical protein